MARKAEAQPWGMRRPRAVRTMVRLLELIERFVGGTLIVGIAALVIMQVLARVTPIPSEPWTGELARFFLVWIAFGMAGYLMGRDEHITLDVADHVVPPLAQRLIRAFALLVVAATSAVFAYEGLHLFTTDSAIKSPAAGIPLGWIYFIPMIGMMLTVLRALLELVFPESHTGVVRVAGETIAESPPPLLAVKTATSERSAV